MKKTRIFLACADERLRIAMLLLLDNEPGMIVVGITDRLPGLLAQLQATQPDALLLEWELPLRTMTALLADIHNLEHTPKIIFLSRRPEDSEIIKSAGADHLVVKNAPPDELLSILNNISYV